MIILIGGEKGGPGKTTLATNLSAMRTKETGDLLLMDTDKQQTASFWCSTREDNRILPRVSSIQKVDKAVRSEALALKEKYKDIIIDAGGRDSAELRGGLLVADKAIFPLRPSQFDLWTFGRINTLVETALEINETLKSFVVLNQASTNPSVKEVEEAKSFISEFPCIKLLNIVISERIIFRRAAISGMSVTEYRPEDVKATEEMRMFYNEVFNE
jgi:chromosome partitioning protein